MSGRGSPDPLIPPPDRGPDRVGDPPVADEPGGNRPATPEPSAGSQTPHPQTPARSGALEGVVPRGEAANQLPAGLGQALAGESLTGQSPAGGLRPGEAFSEMAQVRGLGGATAHAAQSPPGLTQTTGSQSGLTQSGLAQSGSPPSAGTRTGCETAGETEERSSSGRGVGLDSHATPPPRRFDWGAELPEKGRLLGIDYGHRRIGLAVSNSDQTLASPVVNRDRTDLDQDARFLRKQVTEYGVVGIVIGLPVHLSGDEGAKSREAREFGAWVARVCARPVRFHDERYSTRFADELLRDAGLKASQRQGRRDMLAAQYLLQAYLDSRRDGEAAPVGIRS